MKLFAKESAVSNNNREEIPYGVTFAERLDYVDSLA